jgi:hypothetical protein
MLKRLMISALTLTLVSGLVMAQTDSTTSAPAPEKKEAPKAKKAKKHKAKKEAAAPAATPAPAAAPAQ